MFIVHTLDEIQGLIDAHGQFKATLGEADKEFQSIMSIIKDIENFARQYNVPGATINPYTNLTGGDINSKWNEVKTLVPQRDQTLQDELRKQQNNEALRRQFADKANQVGPWIEKQMDAVAALGMGMQGSLEEQLGRLREYEEAVYQFKPHLEELERINQQIQESFVFENRYSQYTMETLRVGWEQLVTSVNRTINEVENQILTRDSKGITQEQLNEFRASFNHFDKSRSGRLSPEEFKSCLISLGYSVGQDRQGEIDFQRILSIVDPNASGYVQFDCFLDFMTRESTDVDTAEQVIDSFRILAADKVRTIQDILSHVITLCFYFSLTSCPRSSAASFPRTRPSTASSACSPTPAPTRCRGRSTTCHSQRHYTANPTYDFPFPLPLPPPSVMPPFSYTSPRLVPLLFTQFPPLPTLHTTTTTALERPTTTNFFPPLSVGDQKTRAKKNRNREFCPAPFLPRPLHFKNESSHFLHQSPTLSQRAGKMAKRKVFANAIRSGRSLKMLKK